MKQNTIIVPSDPASTDQTMIVNRRVGRVWDKPLDEEIQKLLINACKQNDNEVCGFITADEDIFYVKNAHQQPRYNFFMDKESMQSVVTDIYDIRQTKIIGIFHTHPNNQPWPSPRDLVGWPNPDLKWRYFIATNREVIEWELVVR